MKTYTVIGIRAVGTEGGLDMVEISARNRAKAAELAFEQHGFIAVHSVELA